LVPGLEAGGVATQRGGVCGAWGRQRDRLLLLRLLRQLWRQPFLRSGVVFGGGDGGDDEAEL
jgi:hypothetical protein